MHMADALLSPAVGAAMYAVSAAAAAYSVAKIKEDDLCEKKIPVMAVSGALVFAGQMINFTIPATGSSGHIGGGILLAGLLGAFPAFIALMTTLIIQCLFFADGGLLALGCNIFNMAVIPCLLVYPLLFKPIVAKGLTYRRISAAAVISAVLGLQLGAFSVVLETQLSGITALPFSTFVLLMQPIHLAIGVVEGIVTAAILCFVYNMRPEILESANAGTRIADGVSMKKILTVLACVAFITGGLLSLFASAYPDGLEWAVEKTAGAAKAEVKGKLSESAASIQEALAFMPDYGYKSGTEGEGTTVAGVVGGAVTFALAGAAGCVISAIKKTRKT
ncbi:MAG: energy-coupling factor ABC transporter permease [Clostridiales Family XIII bacterium]|jgi:cobalt/nickel transport system permease protein|nr:energy-coupling factor ABC transporter permease [Clostridiales Family XIII bacterium]